jgi:pimeloyl-ACP methyl ester carboxylesterase
VNDVVAGDPRQLVFVHGIGGLRDAIAERDTWLAALARGADLPPVDVRFVDYSSEFTAGEAQGGAEVDAELLLELVDELVAELSEEADPLSTRVLADARMQLSGAVEQGPGQVVRTLANVLTTVLALPALRGAVQWASGRALLGHLAQVSRYLRRDGLDTQIRARVHEALAHGPSVVVAHSLGSIVAFEALHEHASPLPLLVTLGSPLAMSTVVWHRLAPRPPRTPACVARWLNFWDRDDVVVARPRLDRRVLPSEHGVIPETTRVDSTGIWTHTATKYLAQPAVGRRIADVLG